MKKGFTLVELSIVLVIIGLLIGGVLIGQGLISSVKTQRLISDLRQYEVALIQFQKKFKQYPGDSTYFVPSGNGDSRLGTMGSCTGAFDRIEQNHIWAHLSQAGMISKIYAAFSPISTCPGGVHAQGYDEMANAGIVWPYTNLSGVTASAFGGATKYPIGAFKGSSTSNFYFLLYVNPLDAISIEDKFGSQNYNGTDQQVGLANHYGVGLCSGGACGASSATYGELHYYIVP